MLSEYEEVFFTKSRLEKIFLVVVCLAAVSVQLHRCSVSWLKTSNQRRRSLRFCKPSSQKTPEFDR